MEYPDHQQPRASQEFQGVSGWCEEQPQDEYDVLPPTPPPPPRPKRVRQSKKKQPELWNTAGPPDQNIQSPVQSQLGDVESGRFPTPTAPDATKGSVFFRRYKEVERNTTARSRNRLVMQRTPSPQPGIGILPLMAGPPQTPSAPAGSESPWSLNLFNPVGNDPSAAEGDVNTMDFFDEEAWEGGDGQQSGSAGPTSSSSLPVSTVAHSSSVPDPATYYNSPDQSDPYTSDPYQSNPYDSNPYDSNPYQNNPDPPNPYDTNPYAPDPNNLPYTPVVGSGTWTVPVPVRIPGQGGGSSGSGSQSRHHRHDKNKSKSKEKDKHKHKGSSKSDHKKKK